MATGSQADFVSRLKAVLPPSWFPSTSSTATTSASPILDAALNGCAWVMAAWYGLYLYAVKQSRIASSTDMWLGLVSRDFFGLALPRRTNESDTSFRNRILVRLLRPAATRASVLLGLFNLTGRTATMVEPWSNGDCGSYTTHTATYGGNVAYNTAGAWGSMLLPAQCFIQAHRPNTGGIANVGGYYYGTGWGGGGYGVGAIEYISTALVAGNVSDADIYATVNDLMPAGTIAWVNISN